MCENSEGRERDRTPRRPELRRVSVNKFIQVQIASKPENRAFLRSRIRTSPKRVPHVQLE